MYFKRFVLLIVLIILAAMVFSDTPDTIPPKYVWTSPKQFSILTTNTVRLSVDAQDNDNGSGIKNVVFYARYWTAEGRYTNRKLIGKVAAYPYEFIWNCSEIPDHDYSKINFYCDVVDNEGNVCSISEDTASELGPLVVLDRNSVLNETLLHSRWTKMKIVIDGNLSEWAPQDSIVFNNNDNTVTVYSAWNNNNVFFGIRIDDSSIISHFFENTEEYDKMPLEDIIEVYLDTNHDHYEIRGKSDISFLAAAGGKMYKRIAFIDSKRYNSQTYKDINCVATVNGTLNDESDTDRGYTIELAIPWDELDVAPGTTTSMGLEVWNNDKDYIDGNYFYAGWTSKSTPLNNPSEWGNIDFTGGSHFKRNAALLMFAMLVIIICFSVTTKLKHKHRNDAKIEKEYIRKAKKYIEENYSVETLSREDIAGAMGFTASYFGHLFKKETGLNVKDYLTLTRIEKAKTLLLTTDKTISEISYEVGFGSQSYFGRKFKEIEKVSPKEYRTKYIKQ